MLRCSVHTLCLPLCIWNMFGFDRESFRSFCSSTLTYRWQHFMLCKSSATTTSSLKVCTLTYVHPLSLSLSLSCSFSVPTLCHWKNSCMHVFWCMCFGFCWFLLLVVWALFMTRVISSYVSGDWGLFMRELCMRGALVTVWVICRGIICEDEGARIAGR